MSRPRPAYILLVLFVRLLIVFSTRGFFQPDEYFQALEPAYRAVFGSGHLTWEWTANPPIRSFIYPSLFVPPYALLKVMHLQDTPLLIWAPKLVQAVFAALGDLALYRLASSLLTEAHGKVALFLSLISPFNTLALTRTLANSTETSLTVMALSYWPYSMFQSRSRTRLALGLAAFSCMVRPTAAILWTFLGLELLWRSRSSRSQLINLVFDVSIIGFAAAATIIAVDTMYYGTLVFTPLSFLKTNLVSGIAQFYGANAIHYYLTQGLPIILGPALPFAVLGIRKHFRDEATTPVHRSPTRVLSLLMGLVGWTIAVYSLLAHKEWRFIHPVLPILHIFAADYLVDNVSASLTPNHFQETAPTIRFRIRRSHLLYMIVTCVPLDLYLIRWHGSAQIAATRYIHDLGMHEDRVRSVGVLMPCHSIPWQAYFHLTRLDTAGHRIWALGCEPPLGLNSKERAGYTSQTDVFFNTLGALGYFERYFPASVDETFPPAPVPFTTPGSSPPERGWNHTWPSHLIMFGALEKQQARDGSTTVKEKLEGLGYRVIWRAGNGWEEDERRRGGTVIWEWTGTVQ